MGRVDDFQRDGAVVVRAAFTPAEVEQVTRGIQRNLAEPSPRALVASRDDDPGRFFEDFCNWSRFHELEQVIRESQAAAIAGELTRSSQIRLYHDHVLVKEAATRQPTPWHQDQPYYNVEGSQTCSVWMPVDPVPRSATLEFVAGSHLGPWLMPRTFMDGQASWFPEGALADLPDIEADRGAFPIIGWELEPGDAVFFNMLTLHASGPSDGLRRAFSIRFIGDDVTHAPRAWKTSPEFPGLIRAAAGRRGDAGRAVPGRVGAALDATGAEQRQPAQRQPRIDMRDGATVGSDHIRVPPGRHHRQLHAQLATKPGDKAVHHGRVPEHRPGSDGFGGVALDGIGRGMEIDHREAVGVLGQCRHRDSDPRGNRTARPTRRTVTPRPRWLRYPCPRRCMGRPQARMRPLRPPAGRLPPVPPAPRSAGGRSGRSQPRGNRRRVPGRQSRPPLRRRRRRSAPPPTRDRHGRGRWGSAGGRSTRRRRTGLRPCPNCLRR